MKYERTYHYIESPGATNDDKISHNTNALLGREIVITEKLDGSNSGFKVSGPYGRSHAAPTENAWDRNLWDIYNSGMKDWLEFYSLEWNKEISLFGENMYAIHSIVYQNLTRYFYAFGIRMDETWVSWDNLVELCDSIELNNHPSNIQTVPLLYRGVVNTQKELNKIIDNLMNSGSTYGSVIEGLVIRWADEIHTSDWKDAVQKIVRPNHVTTDVHWTRNWEKAELV